MPPPDPGPQQPQSEVRGPAGPEPGELAARRTASIDRATAETGIDPPMIDRLVDAFYARIQVDPVLGPIFASKITEWVPHLARMKLFWGSVMLQTGAYQGRPMEKHVHLPADSRHFDRWLGLFEDTAQGICGQEAASAFVARARRIAESLELGIAMHQGGLPRRGERWVNPAFDHAFEKDAS